MNILSRMRIKSIRATYFTTRPSFFPSHYFALCFLNALLFCAHKKPSGVMICTPQYWTPSIGGTYHAARRFLGFSLTFFPSKCCAAAPILSSKSWSTPGNAFAVVDALCHHNTEAGLTGIQISVTNLSVSLVMPQSMSVTSREKPPICILCLSI